MIIEYTLHATSSLSRYLVISLQKAKHMYASIRELNDIRSKGRFAYLVPTDDPDQCPSSRNGFRVQGLVDLGLLAFSTADLPKG